MNTFMYGDVQDGAGLGSEHPVVAVGLPLHCRGVGLVGPSNANDSMIPGYLSLFPRVIGLLHERLKDFVI